MEVQVNKWGNSMAVRLPAKLLRELAVDEGGLLQVKVTGPGQLTLTNAELAGVGPTREQVIAELEALHHALPLGRPVVRYLRDKGY